MSGKLIIMTGRGRFLTLFGLAAILLVLSTNTGGGVYAATRFQRYSQEINSLQLEAWISPDAGQPGDQVFLNLSLSASDPIHNSPELLVSIPDSLELDITSLPKGTSFNLRMNSVVWRPVGVNTGDTLQLTLPLKIGHVNIGAPLQTVDVLLKAGRVERKYAATLWAGLPPQASISFRPLQAAVGQIFQLIADVEGPGPITQQWDLGDGRIILVNDPEVVFSSPGVYQISLRASNPIASSTTSAEIVVTSNPIASFSVAKSLLMVGEPALFQNHSGGQQPLLYDWDFGDGTGSEEHSPIHRYSEPGTYRIHLTIVSDLGQSDTYQEIIVGQPPIGDIVVSRGTSAGERFEVQAFHDNTVSKVIWDMGDGNTYEGELINHVYWSAGDYRISATIVNDFGKTVIEKWIQVGPGTTYLFMPLVLSSGASQSLDNSTEDEQTVPESTDEEQSEEMQQLALLTVPEDMLPAEKLFAYINEARYINDLPPLNMVYELNVAAQSHTDDMASQNFTGHEGSDGSSPALRIQRAAYSGGYTGEATAWGMQAPIDPVQFWLTSPAHREIILNPVATDVGVGYSLNYNASSVWYWTAEFASSNLPRVSVPEPKPEQPAHNPLESTDETSPENITSAGIQLLGPPQESMFNLSDGNYLIFTWSWLEDLSPDHRFTVYLNSQGRIYQIGVVRGNQPSGQYQFKILTSNIAAGPGTHYWLVRFENEREGTLLFESTPWPITFRNP